MYALGLLGVAIGFAAFWLQTPAGIDWLQLEDDATDLRMALDNARSSGLLYAPMTLLPMGWLLLAHSVRHWRIGLIAYLIPMALACLIFLVGEDLVSSLRLALLWPFYLLAMLGVGDSGSA
jgi:hypothetical protein